MDTYEANLNGDILRLTRQELEQLIGPLVERTMKSCRQSLKDAGLTPADIDAVVMVGGSTRVPLVRETVSAFLANR